MSPIVRAARFVLYFVAALAVTGAGVLPASGSGNKLNTSAGNRSSGAPVIYTPHIINTYPHDPQAFTQGLFFQGRYLHEGTGLYGKSSLRKIVLETGEVVQRTDLPSALFGEGIAVIQDRIIQLTWRSRVGFVYDRESFKLNRVFRYPTEGWGIASDGVQLVMSDGTEFLYFLDPETYEVRGRIRVHDDKGPVAKLNELEYVRGLIYANVWQSSRIAIIDPATGQVNAWIELRELVRTAGGDNTTKTLNGIAYDREAGRLFITGKLWSSLYEIQLVPSSD